MAPLGLALGHVLPDPLRRSVHRSPLVLAHCLGVAGEAPAPDVADWEASTSLLLGSRLAPVALDLPSAVRRNMPAHVARTLREQTFELALRQSRLMTATGAAVAAMESAGFEFLVLKGPGAAALHPNPRSRTYTDVDLLVRPSDFHAAMMLLDAEGLHLDAAARQPWPAFDRYCREGVNLADGVGAAVDLHHRIPPWCFSAQLGLDVLLPTATNLRFGPVDVRVPAAADAAVIAALAVLNDLYKGDAGFLAWRDLAAVRAQIGDHAFRRGFAARQVGWLGALVLAGLDALARLATGAVPPLEGEVDLEVPAVMPPVACARLRLLGWEGSGGLARHPLGWVVRLPPLNALAFLAGSAVPSPWFARTKHAGYLSYWNECLATMWASARGTDFRITDLHDPTRRERKVS
jgi:hypothetical protein